MISFIRKTLLALLVICFMLLFSACGSKRNPTGGPQDTNKPSVLGSSPAEYGEINKGVIEISFSKEMDKSTLTNSIYIYPPVINKKVSLDKATLKIKLNETLKQNTNYYVTLSTRLKDTRGNPMEQNQTLVFKSGELNNYRVSGAIDYEQIADNGMPIELSVLSTDSLLVLSNRIKGETYSIETLNPQAHIIRAYIDKNLNGRYDFGTDPFFEGKTENMPVATLNLNFAYADSTKPKISKILPVNRREIQVKLSEPVKSYDSVAIIGTEPLRIYHHILENDVISILTAPMDSTEYTIQLRNVIDFKGNRSMSLEAKYRSTALADTTAPKVIYTNPRNGASVSNLKPVLEISFSELLASDKVIAQLHAGKDTIPLKQLTDFGRMHRFQPTQELANYKTHTLTILATTSDASGNKMKQAYELQFLPLKRDK